MFNDKEKERLSWKEKGGVSDGHVHSSYSHLRNGASLMGRGDGHLHPSFSDLGDGEMAAFHSY